MDKVLLRIVNSKPLDLEALLSNRYIKEKDMLDILRFLKVESKKERAAAFILRNKYIGQVYYSSRGKPLSKSKFFNISHSKGVAVLATSSKDLGVDLEVIRPVDKKLKEYVTNKEEKKYITDDESFFKIWTNKESLLKCLGMGIKSKMDKVPALPFDNVKYYDDKYVYSKTIVYKNMVITVARMSDEPFEIEIKEETI